MSESATWKSLAARLMCSVALSIAVERTDEMTQMSGTDVAGSIKRSDVGVTAGRIRRWEDADNVVFNAFSLTTTIRDIQSINTGELINQ